MQAKLLQTCQALEGSGGTEPLNYVAGDEAGKHSPVMLQHSLQLAVRTDALVHTNCYLPFIVMLPASHHCCLQIVGLGNQL